MDLEKDLVKAMNNPNKLQTLWIELSKKKKCIYCSKKFKDGIVNKHPNESKFALSAHYWFTAEYLVHCQTTHGYHPDTMTEFLETINNK